MNLDEDSDLAARETPNALPRWSPYFAPEGKRVYDNGVVQEQRHLVGNYLVPANMRKMKQEDLTSGLDYLRETGATRKFKPNLTNDRPENQPSPKFPMWSHHYSLSPDEEVKAEKLAVQEYHRQKQRNNSLDESEIAQVIQQMKLSQNSNTSHREAIHSRQADGSTSRGCDEPFVHRQRHRSFQEQTLHTRNRSDPPSGTSKQLRPYSAYSSTLQSSQQLRTSNKKPSQSSQVEWDYNKPARRILQEKKIQVQAETIPSVTFTGASQILSSKSKNKILKGKNRTQAIPHSSAANTRRTNWDGQREATQKTQNITLREAFAPKIEMLRLARAQNQAQESSRSAPAEPKIEYDEKLFHIPSKKRSEYAVRDLGSGIPSWSPFAMQEVRRDKMYQTAHGEFGKYAQGNSGRTPRELHEKVRRTMTDMKEKMTTDHTWELFGCRTTT